MRAPVCPYCGAVRPPEPCAECGRSHGAVEWTAEPRGWSAARAAGEGALVLFGAALLSLPLAHGLAAALVLAGTWRTAPTAVARVFVGGMLLVAAAVEVSLLRGLAERLAVRWARRWSFRAPGGGGWARIALRKPLSGFGVIRDGPAAHKWMADYVKGQRTRLT